MAIVFDNAVGVVNSGVSPVSTSITVSKSNPLLVAAVTFDDTGKTVSSITYKAQQFTRIGGITQSPTTGSQIDVWYLKAPTLGSGTVTATFSPGGEGGFMVACFGGIDQFSPLDASNSAGADSSSVSVGLTTVAANTVIVEFGHNNSNGNTVAPTAGQTETVDANTDFDRMFSGHEIVSSATTYTQTWTITASIWADFVASFKMAEDGVGININNLRPRIFALGIAR